MTKAVKIYNYYNYKAMLLEGNPQFENFRKEELINFCIIAKELLKGNERLNNIIKEVKELRKHLAFEYYEMSDDTNCGEIIKQLDEILVKENK